MFFNYPEQKGNVIWKSPISQTLVISKVKTVAIL